MKKVITASLSLMILLGLNSCDSFLDESPKSELSSEGYLLSEAQAKSNINYLYRTGAPKFDTDNGAYYGTHGMLGGYLTGYFTSEYAGQELAVGASQGLNRTADNCNDKTGNIWENCYKAINVANYSIKYTSDIAMSESLVKQYVAEAKFFRAFNYFYLVKFFGDVPFYTEPYTGATDDLTLPRTDSKTIYNQIVNDLRSAIEDLPAKSFYNNSCRIGKTVAQAMLSRVYLQMSGYPINENHYGDAASVARDIINSSIHSLTLNDDLGENSAYNKLRTNDGLSEVIYALEYDLVVSTATRRPAWSFPNKFSSNFKSDICNNVYGLSNGIESMYDETDDLRYQPNQFFHWEYVLPGDTEPTDLGATCNWYFYDEDCMLSTFKSEKDANIIRYAEILLTAAEAIAQTEGVTAEAVSYLAKVKARASLTGKDYTSELSTLSKEAFIEEVWAERLRELPLEFLIWDDCIRTQKFPVFSSSNKGEVSFVSLIGAKNGAGLTFKESDLLWPLPFNEMQRNPNLIQNPGY